MVSTSTRNLVGTLLVALTAASSATADDGKGLVAYVPHNTENFQLPDRTPAMRMHSKGVVSAEDPSNAIHLSTQDCTGTYLLNADSSIQSAAGYCDGVDRAGDMWWIWWKGNQDGSDWGFIRGTGKWEGVEGGGTTKTEMTSADGRLVIAWEGTWTTK